ncbi:hypothetical protein ACF09E_34770 [Streptomyces sp. NPDC014891]|uniref:hypothetical protein n=1 Tax=Streptomyces sp. NPDC014891 TaxID=3364929 RepID=UPI0036FCEE80
MTTARLNRIAAAGTEGGYRRIRFADGCMITVEAQPDATEFTEVALWPGLTAPSTDAWAKEDQWGLNLTDQDGEGRSLFLEVPVDAVRALIEEHGGEHADQDEDLPTTRHHLSPRSATGIYRVPLDDLDDPPIGRIIRHDDYWLATPSRGESRRSFDYDGLDEAAAYVVQEADIAAGRATRAAQDLRQALAPYGLTAHRGEDVLIGGYVLSWLSVGSGDTSREPDGDAAYLNVYFSDPTDGGEVTVDRPARASDEWVIELNSGTGDSAQGPSFPGLDAAAVAAYIAHWHRDPAAAWSNTETERSA